MRQAADAVMLAAGWRRALVAWLAGAVGALAMPPFGFWPALAPSLAVAVWLVDGSAGGGRHPAAATLGRAALAGWFWGFGYFVAGLWWIGSAFLVEADVFAWALPFGVLGLPALLAFFTAFGFALARALWSRGAWRVLALAFGLSTSEWLRGHMFTGFPWNTLGLALGQNLYLMQSASLVGMYGLTALAIAALATPALLATGETARARWAAPTLAAALLVAMTGYGLGRVPSGPSPTVPGVKLRIMQPNLPQDEKFRPAAGADILHRYLALSDQATSPSSTGLVDVTHLVWPESAFPFLLHRNAAALAEIARALPRGGVLITGAARLGEALPGESGGRYFNAIQVVADDGSVTATYDKVHLVPFGEYVPGILETLIRGLGLRQFVRLPGGFTPGARRTALPVPGMPSIVPTICYEAIFPDEVTASGPDPGVILNVTNDAWFGDTPGPRQHFAQARLRAVERGLPLVRAANTGISAVVDAYGRVVASLPVGTEGVLDAGLPTIANRPFFNDHGNIAVASLLGAALAGAAFGRFRERGRPAIGHGR